MTASSPRPVTPYAGVWIEIEQTKAVDDEITVTPYAGVWIEIFIRSFPKHAMFVTPYAGVWIEIPKTTTGVR